MADREIVGWFTRNGKRIPIFKGEGKMKALGNYLKDKQKAKVHQRHNEWFDKADKATSIAKRKLEVENEYKGGNIYSEDEIYWDSHDVGSEVADAYMQRKYGKNWNKYSNAKIKGYKTTTGNYNANDDADNLIDKAWGYRFKAKSYTKPRTTAEKVADVKWAITKYKEKRDYTKASVLENALKDYENIRNGKPMEYIHNDLLKNKKKK